MESHALRTAAHNYCGEAVDSQAGVPWLQGFDRDSYIDPDSDDINDDVIKNHLMPRSPDLWVSTDHENTQYTNDRLV